MKVSIVSETEDKVIFLPLWETSQLLLGLSAPRQLLLLLHFHSNYALREIVINSFLSLSRMPSGYTRTGWASRNQRAARLHRTEGT